MMNLSQVARGADARFPNIEPARVARMVERELSDEDRRSAARQAIEAAVDAVRRERVRELERQSLEAARMASLAHRKEDNAEAEATWHAEFQELLAVWENKALLREKIALGDGSEVEVGQATVSQWNQRAQMLRGHIEGEQRSLRICQLALGRLEETGASCLDESLEETSHD